ncbi:MAG: chromosome segregation protein, partial [Novosphingobium sp.]
EAAVDAARARLARLDGDAARLDQQAHALAREADPAAQIAEAEKRRADAAAALSDAETERGSLTARREALSAERDALSNGLAQARAELSGVQRGADALARDKAAREKAAAAKGHGASALSGTRAAPGYERALAAVLGRDASAPVGPALLEAEGRFWTGAVAPVPLADSLAHHVPQCPPELAPRLALVRVAESDDGQALAPGEWLVTRAGRLRRWDGFVARGEGAAEAAALEAENRLADLEGLLPDRVETVARAEAAFAAAREALGEVQTRLGAVEKAISAASDAERAALRALDAAEAARARMDQRKAEIALARGELGDQRHVAGAELSAANDKRAALPDPAAGRATLDAARARNDSARSGLLATTAAAASLEQAIAVGRERLAGLKGDIRAWQARAGDAAKRLAEMTGRREELEAERAIAGAKPAGLIREIEGGEAIRDRLTTDLAAAETALTQADAAAKAGDTALAAANEALATAREGRAGASARAENEDARRQEMAGISGERFQCPPPMLPERFEFDAAEVASAGEESAAMDRLTGERERIGPVNLVAAEELAEAEDRHGTSVAEQAELTEAVHRLRGSIGNLNREGRERLRAAFEAVDGHFRRLFGRLFGGGEAHLALIDSDDPLEAGLEIFAQPPGKRLQSLTLLSGGEQALTAVALIFALFLTNPAPICVLDEVDAPLDDANIERFCDLLDAMVAETSTRYLIVTHNAVTMSRMHRLFGVTMVERGVSRLVSVDLGGAVELLEAAG